MPRTTPDSSPFRSGEPSAPGQGRSWRTAVFGTIARAFDAIARAAGRVAEWSRTAAGTPSNATRAQDVGDVVTDAEIESARGLFGLGSGPVDTDPSWPHGRPTT